MHRFLRDTGLIQFSKYTAHTLPRSIKVEHGSVNREVAVQIYLLPLVQGTFLGFRGDFGAKRSWSTVVAHAYR